MASYSDHDPDVLGGLSRRSFFLPAIVGPAGLTRDGLPVGYQAIAASGRDKTAIAFARFVEREIGGFVPPPGY